MDDYTKLLALAIFEFVVILTGAILSPGVIHDAVVFQTYKPLWDQYSNGSYHNEAGNLVLNGWTCWPPQGINTLPMPGVNP